MTFRHLVLLSLALCLAAGFTPLAAQVNIERLRRADITEGLAGQAGLDFTLRAGNVELALLAPSARLDYVAERWNAFVLLQGDFGWQQGQRFSNQALGHVRYGRHVHPRLTLEAFAQSDYDRARRLAERELAGAGVRVALASSEAWRATWGTAWMFEREVLDLPEGSLHPAETRAHRWSNYFTVRGAAAERLVAAATVYAQPRFDDFSDLRILGDARLAVQIVGSVSLQVSALARWDGQPPDGTERLDLTLRTGVAVEW